MSKYTVTNQLTGRVYEFDDYDEAFYFAIEVEKRTKTAAKVVEVED